MRLFANETVVERRWATVSNYQLIYTILVLTGLERPSELACATTSTVPFRLICRPL